MDDLFFVGRGILQNKAEIPTNIQEKQNKNDHLVKNGRIEGNLFFCNVCFALMLHRSC
jgi:hypothetical protein